MIKWEVTIPLTLYQSVGHFVKFFSFFSQLEGFKFLIRDTKMCIKKFHASKSAASDHVSAKLEETFSRAEWQQLS